MSPDKYAYIRTQYQVPAKKGARVEYTGQGRPVMGTVTGVDGAHLLIRLDGAKVSFPYHPTWELRYIDSEPTDRDRYGAIKPLDGSEDGGSWMDGDL